MSEAEDRSRGVSPGTSPRKSRRAADVPVDNAAPRERVSQARARNREALRTYRALADPQADAASPAADPTPTRRQLRIQQQAGTEPAAVKPEPVEPEPVEPDAVEPAAVEAETGALSRRERRRRAGAPDDGAVTGEQLVEDISAREDAGQLSVEDALAARNAIVGEALEQVAQMEESRDKDPFSVDLEILAQQKALAERAAVLNTRAQKIQQLSAENEQRRPQANDPTTAHNLSIVSPAAFVQVPGTDRNSSKAPSTSHIPVVTPEMLRDRPTTPPPVLAVPDTAPPAPISTPSAPAASAEPVWATPAPAPIVSSKRRDALRRDPVATDTGGRSFVLAQAEALAREGSTVREDRVQPVQAGSAYGLDPLDAMTAGLGRVQRMRYMQYSVLGLGAIAFISGVIMIVSGLGG